MSLVDDTAPGQSESLAFAFDLAHPPAKVWRALTDPELLAQWLLPVVGLELDVGAQFTLEAPPQPGWDGRVACRFLEIEPQERIAYAWVVGDLRTVVTFTLTPTASGTHLHLVQSGFEPGQKRNFGGARYGWKMMGGKLIDVLERLP